MTTSADYPELDNRAAAQATQTTYVVAPGATDNLLKFVPPANASTLVTVHVSAIGLTTGNGASYVRSACFRRQAGAPVQVGATAALATFEDVPAWDCTLALVGSSVAVVATGAAAEETRWTVVVEIVIAQLASNASTARATLEGFG